MNETLAVILLTMAGFLAIILSLAVSRSANTKIVGGCAFVAMVVGILFYGYGNGYREGFSLAVVFKTLLNVCRMYSGAWDYSIVEGTPWFSSSVVSPK